MAWNTKYRMNFVSPKNISGQVNILKEDYGGAVETLILTRDGIEISYKMNDWFDSIVGSSVTISFVNNSNDFYSYLDLFTLNEREFKIVIDASDGDNNKIRLFDGFINSNIVEQDYNKNSIVRLTGSNYLEKLNDIFPTSIETQTKDSLINLINNCLTLTDKDTSIFVNNRLIPSTISPTSGWTCLQRVAVENEAFWENNVDRKSATEIIESILKPLDSYIYWWNDRWEIQRYADIWNDTGTKTFVDYTVDGSYGYADPGVNCSVNEVSTNIWDLNLIAYPSISMIPGLKELDVKLHEESYLNLIINDFTNCVSIAGSVEPITPGMPDPPYRTWENWTGDFLYYSNYGEPYQQISNGARRWLYAYDASTSRYVVEKGLVTQFRGTVDPSYGVFNLKWKYATSRNHLYSPGFIEDWIEYDFTFHWYLKNRTLGRYFVSNPDDDKWPFSLLPGSEYQGLSTLEVNGSSFDEATGTYEISISIPFADVSVGGAAPLTAADNDFIFCIGQELVLKTGQSTPTPASMAVFGDVVISASGSLQNNLFKYELLDNISKKTVDFDLFDGESLQFRNIMFTGADSKTRTELWTDDDDIDHYQLCDWVAKNKIQLFNKSTRKISSNVKYGGFLKPLSMWWDEKDPEKAKFLLTNYSYKPLTDDYRCEWWEYDNQEEITGL